MSETALARCRRPDVTHHAGCACHEQGWQNKWEAAVEMAARAENELARLREVIRAAAVLIAAKGRHNTMLAYQGLRDALALQISPEMQDKGDCSSSVQDKPHSDDFSTE